MEKIIEIKDLNFNYANKPVFKRLNLNVYQGEWLSIIGPNGSGKSTIVKLIIGLLESNHTIKIGRAILTSYNIKDIRKHIGVVFENPEKGFVAETVLDEIAFTIENLDLTTTEIKTRIKEVSDLLALTDLLEKEPQSLSGGQKQRVAIACALVAKPKILILDEALSMLDYFETKEIIRIVKTLNETQGVTIINVTNNLEETIYADRIVVLNKGEKVLEGNKYDVLKEDRILQRLGFKLPFLVELSLKLKYYGLVDDIELDPEKLVDQIWK